MRRISLAFALVGAVAAAGCGGSVSGTNNGGDQGVAEGTFTVAIQNTAPLTITGGRVTSSPAGIDCGVGGTGACSAMFPNTATVVLTATATTGNEFFGWAGDCGNDTATCNLTGKADKYVVAQFGTAADRTGHPNWTDAVVHAAKYQGFALQCNACHGLNWKGGSIAPSCYQCHDLDAKAVTPAGGTPVGGHFDATQEAWTDHTTGWSQTCQRCHTNQGFRDYIGELDGVANYLSGTFKSDATATTPPGGTGYANGPLQCKTCHNAVSDPTKAGLTKIMFVSGKTVSADTATGLCGQCHQGRESTTSIDTAIGVVAADAQINAAGVSFKNPHYLGAAATIYGQEAAGWAQYPSKFYTGANKHGGVASCSFCHDAHTGALPTDAEIPAKCGTCHLDETTGLPVASFLQLEESRQYGFEGDVDGDGTAESLRVELDGLEATLYTAIKAYATNVVGTSVVYDGAAHPYWYIDANADGVKDAAETTAFKAFTPRLLRAAFNYKWSQAEPGAWAHNPRYAVEVLFDAITDLKAGIVASGKTQAEADVLVEFRGFRSFDGHFGGARAAAPYRAFVYSASAWSADGQPVAANQAGFSSAACYQCHGGAAGMARYLSNPTGSALVKETVTGFQCSTCHSYNGTTMKGIRTDVTKLYFPPQKTVQTVITAADLYPKAADRVCATCHSGRESKGTLDVAIGTATGWTLGFTNPHYLGAAGVMWGDQTKMLYQYAGQTYAAAPAFFGSPYGSPHGQSCTGCHQPVASKHTFEIDRTYCDTCHVVAAYGDFRLDPPEINVANLKKQLYKEIQAYAQAAVAAAVTGANEVCYNPSKHPYWYVDAAPQNAAGANCGSEDTAQAKLNPQLLKAAFNYKWISAEPGAGAHNYEYATQILIDSIKDLNPAATLPCDAKADGLGLVTPGTCDPATGVGTPEIPRP